jgi:hypothetical protein
MQYFAAPGLSGVPVSGLGALPPPDSVQENNAIMQGYIAEARRNLDNPRLAARYGALTGAFINYARTLQGPNINALSRRHPALGIENAKQLVLAVYLNHSPFVHAWLSSRNQQPNERTPDLQAQAYAMLRMLPALSQSARVLFG